MYTGTLRINAALIRRLAGSFMVGISILRKRHLKELNFATIVRGYVAIQKMVVILFPAEINLN